MWQLSQYQMCARKKSCNNWKQQWWSHDSARERENIIMTSRVVLWMLKQYICIEFNWSNELARQFYSKLEGFQFKVARFDLEMLSLITTWFSTTQKTISDPSISPRHLSIHFSRSNVLNNSDEEWSSIFAARIDVWILISMAKVWERKSSAVVHEIFMVHHLSRWKIQTKIFHCVPRRRQDYAHLSFTFMQFQWMFKSGLRLENSAREEKIIKNVEQERNLIVWISPELL